MNGLKEELSAAHVNLSRLQREADAKVLARATNHDGHKQVGGAGGVASTAPSTLEVRIPPAEQRSSGEVRLKFGGKGDLMMPPYHSLMWGMSACPLMGGRGI